MAKGLVVVSDAKAFRKRQQKKSAPPAPTPSPLKGKAGMVKNSEGKQLIMVADSSEGGKVTGKLAVPNSAGLLVKTDTTISVGEDTFEEFNGIVTEGTAKSFERISEFELDQKRMTEVKTDEGVIDYLNVSVFGYASTFGSITPADRDGDVIADDAFKSTLSEFKKNPVMLVDHTNRVSHLAGSFSKMGIDTAGLFVQGDMSNSPHLKHERFLVAEGHLKAFSIGGMFFYDNDGHTIKEVNLFEISLTPVPANQDALFTVRKAGEMDAAKAFDIFKKRGGTNIQLK